MANIKSAQKRVRQIETSTARNRVVKNRLKTTRKEALAAIEKGDAKGAQEAYNKFASAADRAAKKNIIKKNAADRLKGRMAARLNALSA